MVIVVCAYIVSIALGLVEVVKEIIGCRFAVSICIVVCWARNAEWCAMSSYQFVNMYPSPNPQVAGGARGGAGGGGDDGGGPGAAQGSGGNGGTPQPPVTPVSPAVSAEGYYQFYQAAAGMGAVGGVGGVGVGGATGGNGQPATNQFHYRGSHGERTDADEVTTDTEDKKYISDKFCDKFGDNKFQVGWT